MGERQSLDAVVAGERNLRAVCTLVSIMYCASHCFVPIYGLSRHHGQLGLPQDFKLSIFIRRYPNVFCESHILGDGGIRVPCFGLTPEAVDVHQEGLNVLHLNQKDVLDRLCKLLMLTRDRMLPLQTIDQLK